MTRVPTWLRIVASVLAMWSVWTGLRGCGLAQATHASDVYRDDVGGPFLKMLNGDVIDFDKLAGLLGMSPYGGTSRAARQVFEENVRGTAFMYLTNPVVARVERYAMWDAAGHFCAAAICLFSAIVIWTQARKVATYLDSACSASSHP